VCAPDPNAGRREAARQENKKRISKYYSDGIKQWNKEVDFKDNINTILGLGASRSRSDFDAFALSEQGKGLLDKENAAKKYFQQAAVNEGGRSRNFKGSQKSAYFAKLAEVDRKQYALATVGEAKAETKIQRGLQEQLRTNRTNLGFDPQFGPPTMLPPKDRAGQFMNTVSFGMSVISPFIGSDVRIKDNIKKIGTSIEGYNIYKFRYNNSTQEYIGVMAQEVQRKKPEAVAKLDDDTYMVDYSQIDVEFREVA
tara:strand:+ start:3938 stop:4699 length:762 start_codon:yes stop_codon:yes gene_type:complete